METQSKRYPERDREMQFASGESIQERVDRHLPEQRRTRPPAVSTLAKKQARLRRFREKSTMQCNQFVS